MSNESFKAAWWLRNSHLQTLYPVLLRRRYKPIELERERIELPDGDFLDVDWVGKNRSGPIVLVLHGFEGSSASHYAKGMMKALDNLGWRGALMHFRGCSGEANRLPLGYHSGGTNDIAYLAKILRERETGTELAAIGYSLGGNVLLKWLGETGEKNPLIAAVAVSVPFELRKAANRMQHGFSRFYQWYFLKCLRARLTAKYERVPGPIPPTIFANVSSIIEFDDAYTAPLHGFTDVHHYYSSASSRQYLCTIHVPTLIVHAMDDPFMSKEVIPEPHELSPAIKLEVSEQGGHVGFVAGRFPWRPVFWLEQRIPQFLQKYI